VRYDKDIFSAVLCG